MNVMRKKPAFTLIELLVVVSIIALLVAILLPSLNSALRTARRTISSTNVNGIIKSCTLFASSNNDKMPGVYGSSSNYGGVPRAATGAIGISGKVGQTRNTLSGNTDASVAPTRAFWVLIRSGELAPKQFINPNTSDSEDPTTALTSYYDFTTGDNVSYGYQCPFGLASARPSTSSEAGMPLVGDRGPYFRSDDKGTFSGTYDGTTVPSAGQITAANLADDSMDFKAKKWNSPNERYEGQNVGSGDASVRFAKKACAGIQSDNVYTYSNGTQDINFMNGTATGSVNPDGTAGPKVGSDCYLIP